MDLEASTSTPTSTMEVHKVAVPKEKTTLDSLKHFLVEFFFPDNSMHKFKNKSFFMRVVLALQFVFPILEWGPHYNLNLLKSDVISGITIASLAIPQGISYAKLAGLPPILGLYSSFVPPLVYAVLGSSRDMAIGPVSIASLVMGSMLRELTLVNEDPSLYLQVAYTATFFAGVLQASLGFLRLGFILDFLSKPTLIGYMGGAAVIVSLQQLKGLLGLDHFSNQMGIIPVIQSIVVNRKEWKWQALVMGVSFLLFLLVARHISSKWPKLFWVSAAAPLTSVIISTIFSIIFKVSHHGIRTIGHLKEGVNPPSMDMLNFKGPYLGLAVKTGAISGILALTEGMAVGRTFASRKNYQFDGNQEMMAIGITNMAGSCTSCFVTTGSFSRSAVNCNAGCKTAVSNMIMAIVVLLTLLFIMPLFHNTPNVILSAIIITAVIGLIDIPAAVKLWKVDIMDFLACMAAFFGVLLISVPMGLAIAVGISLFKILIHVTRPNIVIMGNVQGTKCYRSISQYEEVTGVPSYLIIGIESPIYFTNSMYVQERILRWVREEEERVFMLKESPLRCIVLDMSAVARIDTSGLAALSELKKKLGDKYLEFVLANPVGEVTRKLFRSKALESFGPERIFMTVSEAIAGTLIKFEQDSSPLNQ
ncbi:probable sulfate transporter 3.4 [Zingiber officinale]|uniref:probable sulfate transporter 3.4 n=1 Tax=Zingiber officinale TaxID=94328 RepID=UPI001C4D0BD6|nr:probable sulfate transporter 3.4 [Zingiber officinale]